MSNQESGFRSQGSVNPEVEYEMQWRRKFNQLCYEVFYQNEKGRQLLQHLEFKHFRSPVAFPNKEASWAYFNEGQNEMIRSFTSAMQSYMNEQHKTAEPKQHKRKI